MVERSCSGGINVGVPPTETLMPDGRMAAEWFGNLKAQLWWAMRDAFKATHEHVRYLEGYEDGVPHPEDEWILLPDCNELIGQVSFEDPHRLLLAALEGEVGRQLRKPAVQVLFEPGGGIPGFGSITSRIFLLAEYDRIALRDELQLQLRCGLHRFRSGDEPAAEVAEQLLLAVPDPVADALLQAFHLLALPFLAVDQGAHLLEQLNEVGGGDWL